MGDDQHARPCDVARGPKHLEDLRLHRDIEGGGRLVTDEKVGIVGDRDRDHHALAFAAGEFMGERAGPAFGLSDTDKLEQFDGTRSRGPLADIGVVDFQRLGDLIADCIDRRQRRHRILEHRADGSAADLRHFAVGQSEQFVAVQSDRSGYVRVLRQQADDRHGGGRLARAGLADERDDLARFDVKVHAAHRVYPLGVGREGDGQVCHREKAHVRRFRSGRALGSTDEFGVQAADMRVDAHDVNATVLRLLGLDHERLTYFYQGLDQRLTGVRGKVVEKVLA